MRRILDPAKHHILAVAIAMLDGICENEVNENGKEMGQLIYELECFLPEPEDS